MNEHPSWPEFVEANGRLGLCIGALKGLLTQVPIGIRPQLEAVILQAEYGKTRAGLI